MPTLVACTGFEFGTTAGMATGNSGNTLFDTITSVSIVTTSPRTGSTYCLEATGAATGARNTKWRSAQFGSTAVLVGGVGLYIASLPSADTDAICVETNGTIDVFLHVSSSGVLTGQVGSTTQTGPTLSTGQWYWIDFKVDCSTGTTTLDWRVDGAAQTQVAEAQTATTIFSYTLGRLAGTATFTFRYDDALASVTSGDYPLGPHAVRLLKPDTGGTTAEIGTANATARFTANGTLETTHNSANILAAISEVPPLIGATATGVHQRTSGSGNAVGIPMTTYTLQAGESVSGLRVLVCGWAGSATANNVGLRTFNGTTETTLFAAADPAFDNSTTTPAWLCKMATLANFDTQTELDALVVRYGYSTDVSPVPGAHAIYAEVAVKEAASSGATATPGVIAATASVPAPTVTVQATVTPSAIAAVAAVPAPSVSTGGGSATATPATVATTTAVPAPTVTVRVTVAASTVQAAAAIPAPTVTVRATVTPATVAAAASVPPPTVSTGSTVAPTTLARTSAVPAPTVSTGSTVTPATVAGTAAVPAPSVTAGGSATATPNAVAATAAISAPAAQAGSTHTATTIARAATVNAPTVRIGATVTLTTVNGVAAIATPTITTTGGATATPATIAAVAAIPSVVVTAAGVQGTAPRGTASTPVGGRTVSTNTRRQAITAKAGNVAAATSGRYSQSTSSLQSQGGVQ